MTLSPALGYDFVLQLCKDAEESIARNLELADIGSQARILIANGWARALARNLVIALLESVDDALETQTARLDRARAIVERIVRHCSFAPPCDLAEHVLAREVLGALEGQP